MYNVRAKYKAEYLRDLSRADLRLLAGEARDLHFVLRHQASVGGHSRMGTLTRKPHTIRKLKRDIARIETILGE